MCFQWVFANSQSKRGKFPRYRVGPGAAYISSAHLWFRRFSPGGRPKILHKQLQNTVRNSERWSKHHALLRKGQLESKESGGGTPDQGGSEWENHEESSWKNQDCLLISRSSLLPLYVTAALFPIHPLLKSLSPSPR